MAVIFEPMRRYLTRPAARCAVNKGSNLGTYVIFILKYFSFPEPLLNVLSGLEKTINQIDTYLNNFRSGRIIRFL